MSARTSAYVRRLRAKLGLTQAQLARSLHVTEQTIYNWERGIAVPTRYDAVVLQHLYDMTKNPATLARAQQALQRAAQDTGQQKPLSSDGASAAVVGGIIGFGLGLLLAELFNGSTSNRRGQGGRRTHKGRSK